MKPQYRFLILIPAVSCFLFCQSGRIARPDIDSVRQWFVCGGLGRDDSLFLKKIPVAVFDSVVKVLAGEKSLDSGAFTDTLDDGNNTRYVLGYKTPPSIRRDTLYPLIIYLHGGTGTQLNTKGAFAWDMLTPLGDTFNLFLASPSTNRDAPWWSYRGLARIMQTLRFMSVRYPINPDKVFLAGVSDGGTGCYMVANTIPEPFAGFFAVSGFGGMLPQLGVMFSAKKLAMRPIYNVNAGKDRIYPLPFVIQFLDELQKHGVIVERSIYPDQEHGFDYRAREFGHFAQRIRLWERKTAVNNDQVRPIPANALERLGQLRNRGFLQEE
jgi:pimeloyl-ACP methyl ester carboxylesterase